MAMKETKKGQPENRKKIKILPFHRVFEQEKVDHKIKCFRAIKKDQDWEKKKKKVRG